MSRAKITLRCPKCNNKGFVPKGPYSVPIYNLGGTERTKESIIRRYICLECGYAWKTIEQFYEDLEVKGMKLLEKLYDYMIEHTPRRERNTLPSLDDFIERTRRAKVIENPNPKQTNLFHE
jgi:hypothetical protein